MSEFTVKTLVESLAGSLPLQAVTGEPGSDRVIAEGNVWRPGLLLAGFDDGCCGDRVQLLGRQEVVYLDSLSEEERDAASERLCRKSAPCVVVADGLAPPAELLRHAEADGVPVYTTRLSVDEAARLLISALDDMLSPQTTVHGTLMDVYGVGLLFTGKSGIGKSECGLDLVANGHRLVGDDVVCVTRTPQGYLEGRGGELLQNYMEIRGVGILDVQAMFGARAVRDRKRIELEVKLAAWSDLSDYERLGFEDETTEILGVEIPAVTLPLVLGKNITVISEVIALNYLLKLKGIHPARDFDRRQRDALLRSAMAKRRIRGDGE
jgi:HPr kinase/phosphorylase